MSNLVCHVLALTALLCGVQSQRYIVPEASLEFLSPRGLRISIPDDDPEIKLVAYHININEEFQGLQHGQFGVDITKKRNGRWSYYIPEFQVKKGDVIYYWIHVIVDKLAYNGLDREYRVTMNNPHNKPDEFIPDRIPDPSCRPTKTTRDGNTVSVCGGDVLLNKKFNDMKGWRHQVTIGGDSPEDEFMVFTKDTSNSWLDNGKLMIKPTLLEDKSNDSFVRSGEYLLEGCTSNVAQQCHRQAIRYLILPPIMSARLSTKDKLSFRYGTVEIKAKLPQGKWIVPELWLEPVNGPASERVVVGLSRGNMDDSEFGWKTLEAGVTGAQSSLGKKTQDTPWAQDFHTFKIVWTPDQITFTVDNEEVHQMRTVNFSVLSKEVHISLGVHVAGNRDFPDSIPNKPWKNTDPKNLTWVDYPKYIIDTYYKLERFLRFWDDKASWYPSWNDASSLQVEYVKVTAL
ncbi:beta-1,3-glucan-binding protein-like isoform X1 [Macrosteles quadrilineatus]|uniref:beta-1,3-glucan-binding protein-like isoform X1 n=1 Tax=Macrosteles quadrilineatus TaxID=74068 RepID=UPI0023E1445C|nr:beta-1,3-glucan-binding protein-like isoform X1 [Macrosteles quadrilineatus]